MTAPSTADTAATTGGPVFIFDGDCGFCTTTAMQFQRMLPDAIRVEPWQALQINDLGLSETDVSSAAYFVDAEGVKWRGSDGVAKAVETMGGPFRLAKLLRYPPVSWVAKPVYALIAKYRYRLPGSTDACRIPQ